MKDIELIKLGKSPTEGDSIIQDHSSFQTQCMTSHSQDNRVCSGFQTGWISDQSVARRLFFK